MELKLPKDFRLHPDQKFIYRISETIGPVKFDNAKRKGSIDKPHFPIKIPFAAPLGESAVVLQVAFYYCPKNSLDDCRAFSRYYRLPLLADQTTKSKLIPLVVAPD